MVFPKMQGVPFLDLHNYNMKVVPSYSGCTIIRDIQTLFSLFRLLSPEIRIGNTCKSPDKDLI